MKFVKIFNPINIVKLVKAVLAKFPLLSVVMNKIKFNANKNIETARTNGKVVEYNPDFLKSLSPAERVTVLSHEVMHILFNHISRKEEKDPEVWNIATDAVINQMLKNENLPLPEGAVDMPFANKKSAEEVYSVLLKQKQNGAPQQGSDEPDLTEFLDSSIKNHDDWNEVPEDAKDQDKESSKENAGSNQETQEGQSNNKNEIDQKHTQTETGDIDFDQDTDDYDYIEKCFIIANYELKQKQAEEELEKMKQEIAEVEETRIIVGKKSKGLKTNVGEVGKQQQILDWRKVLAREMNDENQAVWSYRRADEENDFQARIESLERPSKASVEIMIDTSLSVSNDLIRGFLREIKNILKRASVKAGCFDARFHGFAEIKKEKDVDDFNIVGRGGTSFDDAVTGFSKDKNTYKIVFTDGYDELSNTKQNMNIKNLYWLVYENKDFKPCNGKVLMVDGQQLIKTEESRKDKQTQKQ